MNAPLIYLPEHQRNAANELLQMLNDAMAPYADGNTIIDKRLIDTIGRRIAECIRTWLNKHSYYSRFNIDFQLQVKENDGKIIIIPSYDLQRLLAGSVFEEIRSEKPLG